MLIANGLRKVDMQDLLVFLQVHQRQNLVEVDLAVEQCFGGQFGTQAADVQADPRAVGGEPSQECRKDQQLDASNANLVDTWLRRQGRSREVAARANSYVAALQLLSGSDFVLMLPRRIHALLDDVRHHACLAPPGLPPFALHLSWSRAADQDPANLWLREQVLIVCAELGLL